MIAVSHIDMIEFNGFVLAGGKSKRMGADKAFLTYKEKPMLEHMIDFLRPHCREVIISGNKPEFLAFNIPVIPDRFENCGPLGGLFSALNYSATEWNLITGVDTPMLENDLIHLMISETNMAQCIIPVHHGGVEPLVAFYHRNCLPVIEEAIFAGEFKLNSLLKKLDTRYVDCNSLIVKFPDLFFNVNRPEDYNFIRHN